MRISPGSLEAVTGSEVETNVSDEGESARNGWRSRNPDLDLDLDLDQGCVRSGVAVRMTWRAFFFEREKGRDVSRAQQLRSRAVHLRLRP
jgi:hypothetical protein